MFRRALFLPILLLTAAVGLEFAAPAAASAQAAMPTGFLNRTVEQDGATMPYVVYVPRNYKPEGKWPVVMFLHGSGERGADGLKQSEVGLGRAVRMFPERFPAIVIFPQCAESLRWSDQQAALAMKALDKTVEEYHGDPNRLYLTGLSMGGAGSWYLATMFPRKFAAVASLCGRFEIPAITDKLKDVPTWIVVGDQDSATTVAFAREASAAMKAAGSTRMRYTEYPGVPHNCWDKFYAEADFATWLFQQSLSADK